MREDGFGLGSRQRNLIASLITLPLIVINPLLVWVGSWRRPNDPEVAANDLAEGEMLCATCGYRSDPGGPA